MTGAERQRRYRQRHAERVAVLERENADLRAEVERLGRLAAAVAEVGRWSQPPVTAGEPIKLVAQSRSALPSRLPSGGEPLSAAVCRHPAGVVDNGVCGACDAEVDTW
jgi:hypothetical protein